MTDWKALAAAGKKQAEEAAVQESKAAAPQEELPPSPPVLSKVELPESEPGLVEPPVKGGSKGFTMPAWVTLDGLRGYIQAADPGHVGDKKMKWGQAQRRFNDLMGTREGVGRFLRAISEVAYGEGAAGPEAPKKPAPRHKSRRH